ncbi:MAG: RCC1 domain-containing protein [Planctomycetota bacterium]
MSIRLKPLLFAVFALGSVSLLVDGVSAQHYVRSWGDHVFDTSLNDATDFVSVKAFTRGTVALRSDGSVVGWGGIGSIVSPPALPLPAVAVEPGVALLNDGTVFTWGASPGIVPPLPAGLTYTAIATSAALRSDGQIVTWGNFVAGNTPPALPPGLTYVDVASGQGFYVALRSDGQIVAWGQNNLGQTNVTSPPAGVVYVALDVGNSSTLALRSDGEIDAFGFNGSGQTNVPALPSGLLYVKASMGRHFAVALRSDGAVVTWGDASYGQSNVPALPAGVSVSEFAAGSRHGCMLRSDGRIVCWGGEGFFEQNLAGLPAGVNPVMVDATENGVMVLGENGMANAFGFNYSGFLLPPGPYLTLSTGGRGVVGLDALGVIQSVNGPVFPALPPSVRFVDAKVYLGLVAGLRSDGLVESTLLPLPAPPAGERYTKIDQYLGTVGLLSSGQVVYSGNSLVQPPTPSPGMIFTHVTIGTSHGACIRSDGEVETFGFSNLSAMTPAAPAPPLPPGVSYVEVSSAKNHSVARRSDGTIVGWLADANGTPSILGNPIGMASATGIPGATYNQIETGDLITVATTGPTSTFIAFASGCAGSLPSTTLVPEDTPKLGKELRIRLSNLPQGIAFVWAGFSNTVAPFGPLPVGASSLGLPGCQIQIDPQFTVLVDNGGGIGPALQTLAIPSNLALLGATFYEQALVPDVGANVGGFVLSDAVECVVGR